MQIVKGYKVFDKNFRARTGFRFEEGKTYTHNEKLIAKKQGFHFAKRLEDTLRYINAKEEEVIIAEVTSLGDIIDYSDEYYGFYDLYATNIIRIDKVLSREEIIKYALELDEDALCRFIAGFRLTPREIRLFLDKSIRVLKTIEYYQLGNKDAFMEESFLPQWKEVKRYGKYCKKFLWYY